MNRFFYSCLLYLSTPLLLLRLLWRSLRSPAYLQRWSERFAFHGSIKTESTQLVFHAVSVGEVHAAIPLIRRLLVEQPGLNILVTTSTPTGSARVTELLGDEVNHVYLPYDYPGAIGRFLEHFRPRALVIMETELWPNLLHQCRRKGIGLMLANARLSEKSLLNYKKISRLADGMMKNLNFVSAQSEEDSNRLQVLGCPPEIIRISGSLKFDMAINVQQVNAAREDKENLDGRPVLVAASTRTIDGDDEEEHLLSAYKQALESEPRLLLVLVPRHPERFREVTAMIENHGLSHIKRSSGLAIGDNQVLLGDSMGEMHYYLGLGDLVFVGGSLVNTGCQNIIEPAALGLPVITGPSLYNFKAVSETLLEVGAMKVVNSSQELAIEVTGLLADSEKRLAMGQASVQAVQGNQGATVRNTELILSILSST